MEVLKNSAFGAGIGRGQTAFAVKVSAKSRIVAKSVDLKSNMRGEKGKDDPIIVFAPRA